MQIKKSKFYLCKELEVWLQLGEFTTASRAERQMYFVANRTETELQMERKPEYKDFRPVSGAHILAARRPYTIAPPNMRLQADAVPAENVAQ